MQQQQAEGATLSQIRQTQTDMDKLEKMLTDQQKKLQKNRRSPALQKVIEKTRAEMNTQTVENSRKDGLDISETFDTISIDEGVDHPAAEKTKAKKREILFKNVLRGKQFEEKLFDSYKAISKNLEKQITIKVGTKKVRVDAIGYILDENGEYTLQILEFKSSETAPLTRNQADLFPLLAKKGGVVVSRGENFFHRGKEIPPGTIIKVIRGTEGGKWYVSDRFG